MKDYTPEEIAEMHDRNENFVGRTADFSKLAQYQKLKDDLITFMGMCPEVHQIEEIKPNPHEQNALIYADMQWPITLESNESEALAALMKQADSVVISADANHIRFSFAIEKVWID